MEGLINTLPVLPSQNIARDIKWYAEKMGLTNHFGDDMYAVLYRGKLCIHLQWHADTEDDPLLGGSVVRFWFQNIDQIFQEFVERGTITEDKLRKNTPWGTNEFGFYDLNGNAIFIFEDLPANTNK